jgi:hypothetical protein
MRSSRVRGTSRAGNVLVMTLLLAFGLLTMAAGFFQIASGGERRNRGRLDDERAFVVAEAGLNEAYRAVQGGGTGAIASKDLPAYFGGGVLWVTSEQLPDLSVRLVSTGLVGSGRQALEAVIKPATAEDPLFIATLNSKETLTLNEGVLIDSYDSSVGSYASQASNVVKGVSHANENGDVRSNQDVVLNANATVWGDATPGPGYGVAFNTGSFVSGSTAPAQAPFHFPPIQVPNFPSLGSLTVLAAKPKTIPPGDYDYTTLTINKGATLTVQGPANIVVTDFTGGNDAKLQIDATNGPVTFYVENTYTHTAGFQASPVNGSPMALAFLVNGTQSVVFPSNSKVRGGYYTPNANILFSSGTECWGSFAANRLDMANDMRFHFDEALARYWEDDTGQSGELQVYSWRPVPVDDEKLRADRRGPLTVLGLTKEELASPAGSWGMP